MKHIMEKYKKITDKEQINLFRGHFYPPNFISGAFLSHSVAFSLFITPLLSDPKGEWF